MATVGFRKSAGRGPCHRRGSVDYRRALDVLSGAVHRADTRWGRVGETFGEDPYLIGEMASSIVKGYQGGAKAGEPLAKDAILACAKHFAGYSETRRP